MKMIRPYNGMEPAIDATAFVDPMALVAGDVRLGAHSSIWPFVSARGDIHFISIGDHSNIQDNSSLHVTPVTHPVIIGNYVTIGHGVVLHGCTIGNNCLVGMGAIMLDGSELEDNCLLAAGSLLPEGKKIPAGWLALGVPAKPLRKLREDEIATIKKNAEEYCEMAKLHLDAINNMENKRK
jgi:carbonic anhydrase/acetyltransferase-like protein (isoleucine patch superfamily)